jgi:formylglycine-generating enzyme required for sulfatase activity
MPRRSAIRLVFAATLFSLTCHPCLGQNDMALIPKATFEMGISAGEAPQLQRIFGVEGMELFEPEMPKHTVTVGSFYIDRNLVTNLQFKKFVDANPRWQPNHIARELHNGNYLRHWGVAGVPSRLETHPVVNVSWYAAVAYCQWAGKKLPTEAEFALAARGREHGLFPWGDQPVDKHRANYAGNTIGTTTPVGRYPANKFGLFDMAGNVWEFLADQWEPYNAEAKSNPVAGGDLFGSGETFLQVKTRRVIRGGSYGGDAINLWVEYRDSHPPEAAKDFVGFRCAKSAAQEKE